MKASPFIFLILIFFVFCNTTPAQALQAIKFGEYEESEKSDLASLAEQTRKFAEQILKVPQNSKAVIFYYTAIGEKTYLPAQIKNLVLEKEMIT